MKNDLCLSCEPHPEFNVGDKFLVVGEHIPFVRKGEIVTLSRNDGSACPFFKVHSKADYACIGWCHLAPLVEDKNQEQPQPAPAKKDKFEVGDIVEVVDVGYRYPINIQWFDKAAPNLKARYRTYSVNFPKDGDVVKVVAKYPHELKFIGMLYAIERGDKIGLISGEGIKPMKQPPKKHAYTPEQIQEARDIVYRMLFEKVWKGSGCSTIHFMKITADDRAPLDQEDRKNIGRARTLCTMGKIYFTTTNHRVVAFCSPGDEWNDDIGRMVALCKLLNKPLPKWIYSNKGGTK